MRAFILFIFFLGSSLSQFAYGQCTGTPITNFQVTNLVDVSCFGGSDGEIEISLTGGEAPFTYSLVIETGSGDIPIANISNTTDQVVTFTGLFSNQGFGSYKVTVITSNGGTPPNVCTRRVITGIDVAQPALLTASGTVTDECAGPNTGSIVLNISGGNPGYSIVWSGPTAIPNDETNPTGLAAGSYDALITDTKGCTFNTNLVVNPRPDALLSASGPTSICFGSTTTLQVAVNNGTGPYTVVIDTTGSGDNRTIVNYNSGADIVIKPDTDVTYSLVSVTDNNGCVASVVGSENIIVVPPPTANAGSDEATCSLDPFNLALSGTIPTATNFSSLLWSTSGDGSFDDATALTPIYTPGAADISGGTVTLTLTANGNGSCAPATDDMTLTITPAPTADAGSDESVCDGDALDLSTSGTLPTATNFSSLLWSTSGDGGFNDATALTPIYTPGAGDVAGGTVTLTLTANGNGSCAPATDDMVLTITPPPTVGAGSDEATCSVDPFNLALSGTIPTATNFSSLLWSTSGDGGFDDATALTPIYTPGAGDIAGGTVTLTLTANGNGSCAPAADDMILTITPAPTANAGSDESVCDGDVLDLSTSGTLPTATNFSSLIWSTSGDGSFDDATALTPIYTPGAGDVAGGTVTLTLTANGNGSCTPATDDMTLTITPAATANAGSDESVCEGDGLDLSASTTLPTATSFSSLLWSTSGDGSFDDDTALTPIYTPGAADITGGTVTLTLTANGNGSCVPATDDMTLTFTPAPTADAGSDESVCDGDALDLSTSGTLPTTTNFSNLLWSTSGDGSFDDATALTPIYTPGAADITGGTVTLTLTANGNGSCAPATDDMTLTITPAPTANAGSDESVCDGDVLDLSTSGTLPTATNFSSLIWSTSGDGSFDDATALTPIYTPGAGDVAAGTVTLTLTANGNGSCTPATDDMSLTITPAATANAGSDESVCEGDGLDLSASTTLPTATNFSSLLWSTSGDGSFDDATALTPIYTPGAADISGGTVTLTLTANGNGSCAPATDDMTLTITPAPTADAGSDESVCDGDALDLSTSGTLPTATNFSSLLWSTSGDGGFNDATALTPIYTPGAGDVAGGTVTLTLTANGNGSCAPATDDMVLTITPPPTVGAGSDEATCSVDPFNLALSGTIPTATNFSSLLWSTSGDGGFDDATALTPIYTPGAGDIAGGTVTLTLTANGNGSCAPAADDMILTITPAPTANAGSDESVCDGDVLDLSTSGTLPTATNFSSLIWSTSGDGSFDDATALTPIYTPGAGDVAGGTVTLTLTANGNGSCTPATDDMTLTITPAATANAGSDESVCEGDGLDLSASTTLPTATSFSSLLWSTSGDGSFDDATALTPIYTPGAGDIAGGTVTLTLTANGNGSCAPATDDMTVTIQSITPPTAINDGPACQGGDILLSTPDVAGALYDWSGPGGFTSNLREPIISGVTSAESGTYSVRLTIAGCTSLPGTTDVIVNPDPLPTADLSGTGTICPGAGAALTVSLTGVGPWTFVYSDGTGTFTENINSSPYTISVNPLITTTYSPVSVSDANCSGTVSGSAIIDVTPAKNVTIQLDNISGTPGSTVAVPVRVVDFVDLMTMQFTIAWDPTILNYNDVSSINLGNVSSASFGIAEVNNGFLTFSWNTTSLSDTTIVDNTSLFSVEFTIPNTVCSDAPVNIDESAGASTPIEIADENLCLANVTVIGGNVDINATASITSNDPDDLICFGDQVIFTGLPGGLTNYDFYLNGAVVQSGGNSVYVNNSLTDQDSVNVVVGDAQGCTLAAQGIITTVNQISVTPTITDITSCGLSDGEISLAVSGGSGPYTFSWTGPDIIDPALQDQVNLGRGFYAVVVTDDASGCSETINIELKEPVDFTISATKSDVSTTGGNDGSINLTVTGGSGLFDFEWTGPNGFTSTDQNISSLFAGTYIATVSDNGGAGCTDAITVEITQPMNALILSATKTDVSSCGSMDGTVNLLITGGSGSFAISWIGPNAYTSNSQNIASLEGGLYIATVVDLVTSISAQWSVQVDEPEGFAIDAAVTDITYCTSADGSVNLTITGGSGDFGYVWTDLSGLGFASTNKDIADLQLGTYRVVVTDNVSGCIDSLDAVVGRPAICDQPCGLYVESTTNNTSCPDTEDGVAVINIISGGSGPGNYWVSLDTGKTFVPFLGQDITAIIDQGQGSYLYIVRDTITGCTDQTVANVGVSTNLMANISVSDAGCSEDDGIITFNVSGGVVPFEVDIIDSLGNVTSSQGNGFFQFMDLAPGSYFYTVREQSGCTIVASDSIELGVDCQTGCTSLIASARNFEDATCGSDPNGKAIIDVTGGASPYEYSVDGTNWIPFISGNVIDKLPPNGTYNIAIRQDADNADCRTTVSVTIDGPELIVLETPIITTQKATCNQNDGAVKIGRVTGGTGSYNYQMDGAFFNMPSDSIITELGAGIHTFSVIDAVACQADFVFEVESPGVIVASATDVPVSCTSIFLKAGIRIEVDLDSTTLPGPYEAYVAKTSDPNNGIIYQIPDNGIRTILNLDKDFYSVNITAGVDGGCSYSETISVFSGASPVDFEIIDSDSIVSCIGDYGSITIGNVIGDQDTTFIVQLISEGNQILETYEVNWFEFEGGFTIDETNSDKLVAGKYFVKLIQNQDECVGVTAISDLVTIYEPLGQLSFEVLEDEVSLADRPTGYIIGEVIPSGGSPYEARIQLIEPVFELNVTDIIEFNEKRKWEEVPSTGDNLNRFPHRFDSLWAGVYEIGVRDAYGCEYYLEHSIGYDETVFIPNVFTPNDDGYNDTFYIRNLPESGTKVVISNRNGFVVFRSDDYNIDTLWDGGNVSDGIYYYSVNMPSGETYKGWVEKWSGARP